MTYVEWLRVRGLLKWTAIVLGALLLIAAGLRLWIFAAGDRDPLSFVHSLETDKRTRVTHAVLPDGTQRTIVDDPRTGDHVVVDDFGYQGKRIEITKPANAASSGAGSFISVGPVSVESTHDGRESVTTIDTDRPEDAAYYAAIASFVALVLGTLLGAPFARENDGHLEIALTKPIRRETLSLATMGVDLAGIAAGWAMTVVFLIAAHALFEAPHLAFGPRAATVIVLGAAGNLAWYAMLCAATASMKRAYGVVLGLAWPVAALVALLGKIGLSRSLVGQAVHQIVLPLSWIDPFTYLHFGPGATVDGRPVGALAIAPSHELPALLILALAYGALAVWQWRRVEA